MQDRPTAIELLEAAAQFLEADIVPTTEGRRQFQARVAANVLKIVARELAKEDPQLRAEVQALADLLGRAPASAEATRQLRETAVELNRELSQRIRAGEADEGPWRERTLKVVRAVVEDKLRVANPRYLEADFAARAASKKRY